MESLPVLFMTKEAEGREGVAEKTLNNLLEYLSPVNYPLDFYFAVASSSPKHISSLTDKLINVKWTSIKVIEGDENTSPGTLWNQAIKSIFDDGHEMYLRMEDDFVLRSTLEIKHFIELLETKGNVGMVRLGLMPINLNLLSVGWYDQGNNGYIFFDCLPSTSYAYSGNPGLVHKRLHDAVGYFNEQHNPGNIEIDFDSRVRAKMMDGGPRIWWPLELGKYGTYGPWNHIGQVKSYKEN